MITAALILYSVGSLLTMRYLLSLLSDIPGDELDVVHYILAGVMVVGMSLAWPVFWAWLLIDMWRE